MEGLLTTNINILFSTAPVELTSLPWAGFEGQLRGSGKRGEKRRKGGEGREGGKNTPEKFWLRSWSYVNSFQVDQAWDFTDHRPRSYVLRHLWLYITLHYIIKLFIVAKVKKNCKVHYGASHTTMSGYDCRNKYVLSFRRNDNSDVAVVTSRGRVFQILGPAVANERSPTVTRL